MAERPKQFVIVGNGVAGTTCAETLRKNDQDCQIILLGDERWPLYNRVALPPYIKGKATRQKVFLRTVEQHVQRGTGDAVSVGLTGLPDDDEDGDLLVLPGDTPLLRPGTISRLVQAHRESGAACTLLSAVLPDPTGYGRVVRGSRKGVEPGRGDGTSSRQRRTVAEELAT